MPIRKISALKRFIHRRLFSGRDISGEWAVGTTRFFIAPSPLAIIESARPSEMAEPGLPSRVSYSDDKVYAAQDAAEA